MTTRVLIADDSLTIQKVIGITLANSGYELIECLNAAELLKKIQSNSYDLILLDFNLSDSHSGYDLSKKIHQALPEAPIVIMLGTFDTVNESKFNECGITDKIIKPFESTKFIKKCRELIEKKGSLLEEIKIEETIETEEAQDLGLDKIDNWKVDAPQMLSTESTNDTLEESSANVSTQTLDPLVSEIEGWGFTPNNWIEEKFKKTFPPIIEEASLSKESVSMVLEESEEELTEATKPAFQLPQYLNPKILDEAEENVSVEDFWAVDEVEPIKSENQEEISHSHIDEINFELTESVLKVKEEKVVHFNADIDQDELIEKLKISLKPMIEEMVKQFCRQSAEKIAWEIIPDLAENLIRKEIKEISDSVQH